MSELRSATRRRGAARGPPGPPAGRAAAGGDRAAHGGARAPRCSTRWRSGPARRAPAGFKIGATAKRMQEYLGLSGPAAGFMATGGMHRSGATLRFADFQRPGVECELAVRLARDLPPGPCTHGAGRRGGRRVCWPGSRSSRTATPTWPQVGTPTMIGDQVYHAAAMLGEPGTADWRDAGHRRAARPADRGRAPARRGRRRRPDGPSAELPGLAGGIVRSPQAFGGLKAGQVVMLGSVTPPVWLTGPASVSVEFAPLPPVQVRLA